MTAARITINDTALFADPAAALYWPSQAMLIIADLHPDKASLERLMRVLRRYRPRRVACLGASVDDRPAASRPSPLDRDWLARLVAGHDWTWIAGDRDPEPDPAIGGRVMPELGIDSLALRHRPLAGGDGAGELCGHFRPKATVATRGGIVTGPCFVTDGRRMILPAFGAPAAGSDAGGLDVLDPAIAGLFGRRGFRILLAGRDRLYLFTRDRLVMRGQAPAHALAR